MQLAEHGGWGLHFWGLEVFTTMILNIITTPIRHIFITVMIYGYASENLLLTHNVFFFLIPSEASVDFLDFYLTFSHFFTAY